MQLFGNVNLNFMKWKTHLVVASTLLNIFGLAIFIFQNSTGRLNVGIDFKGGTEIQVKFADAVAVGDVRAALDKAGLSGGSVTTFGDLKDNEIFIRLPLQETETQVLIEKVKGALRGITPQPATAPDSIDLNATDEKTLGDAISTAGKFSPDEAKAAASLITAHKKERGGIIRSQEELR